MLIFSNTLFAQATTEPAKAKSPAEILAARREQSKAAILADINTLKTKDQVFYYAKLGDLFREQDKAEAAVWLNKAVEMALNPATEYNAPLEKVDRLLNFFYTTGISQNDNVSANKLRAAIAEILLRESKTPRADEYRGQFLSFAQLLIKSDSKQALEFALLSLGGNKPVHYTRIFDFFTDLRDVDEASADRYLVRLIETLRKNDDKKNLESIFDYLTENLHENSRRAPLSDAQRRLFYETMAAYIQTESAELFKKTATDCYFTRLYGKPSLDEFKRLVPAEATSVEQAINVCQAANIDDWRKPEPKFSIKTSQDALDAANSATDDGLRQYFTFRAAALAAKEGNNRRSIEILDAMSEDWQTKLGASWDLARNNSTLALINQLYGKKDYAEIMKTLENSPPHLRPYIKLNVFNNPEEWRLKDKQMNSVLLEMVRAEFSKAELPQPKIYVLITFNPAKFQGLVAWYAKNGTASEALDVFDEYIDLMNRLAGKYTFKSEAGDTYAFFYYYRLAQKFVEENYERLFQDAQKLESAKVRLELRLALLSDLQNTQRSFIRYSPIRLS